MIYPKTASSISVQGFSDSKGHPHLFDGMVVRVKILGTTITGATHILINGKKYSAIGFSFHKPGEEFEAVVRLKDTTIFLDPRDNNSSKNALASPVTKAFGLPDSVYSHLLISNLQTLGTHLQPTRLKTALVYVSKYTDKKEIACEAAAILEDSGFDWDEIALDRLVKIMSGEKQYSSEERQSSSDFLNLLKNKKKDGKTWIIHPFLRSFGGRECSGSIRFLVTIPQGSVESVKVTVLNGTQVINFLLSDSLCTIVVQPEISAVFLDKIIVYLEDALTSCGYSVAPDSSGVRSSPLRYMPLDIKL